MNHPYRDNHDEYRMSDVEIQEAVKAWALSRFGGSHDDHRVTVNIVYVSVPEGMGITSKEPRVSIVIKPSHSG